MVYSAGDCPQADRAKLLIMKLKITKSNYSEKIFCLELPCLALQLRFSFLQLFPPRLPPFLPSFLSPCLSALLPLLLVRQQAAWHHHLPWWTAVFENQALPPDINIPSWKILCDGWLPPKAGHFKKKNMVTIIIQIQHQHNKQESSQLSVVG